MNLPSREKNVILETQKESPKKRLTVYEQNENPDYPKTKVKIPEHNGYLIAIYKDEHRLKLFEDNEIIKEYEINIRRELADRQTWEDSQTPEGVFTIDSMNVIDDNAWKRWIRLDTFEKAKKSYIENYPDGETRIQDYESNFGKLGSDKSLRQFNEINSDQKILRGIGLHGGGFSLYTEWTLGCAAMNNEDIIELFDILKKSENGGIGTVVVVGDV